MNNPAEEWAEIGQDDYIKPIRLIKRQDKKLEEESTIKEVDDNADFQCRPIRLGSRNNVTTTENNGSQVAESPIRKRSIRIKSLPIKHLEPKEIPNNEDLISDPIFAICLVDFHHQRGPEIQWWKSNYHNDYSPDLFKNISFQALPDGSHLFEETYSNFNLIYDFETNSSIDDLAGLNNFKGDPRNLKTLFGCSCIRQIKTTDLSAEELVNKEVTRSIVQKAIVVISRKQPIFTKIKEKLLIVTKTFFQQSNFSNYDLLVNLFDNLNSNFELDLLKLVNANKDDEDFFINLNLKETILKFKTNFLIIFKSLLLQKKILIYSNTNLEVLTLFQNNLISLIPNLINSLDYSGCPLIDYTEVEGPITKPTSLNTENRNSLLRFFGLPLQIFNTKNSFWNPYLPLQQIDELSVDSFMVGCSNLLFVNQAKNYGIDIVMNLDTNEISYPKEFPEEFALSYCDKKFINNLINKISSDDDKFEGNDDYIRYQFEDYITSLISTMRYSQYVERFNLPPPGFDGMTVGDLSLFNKKFIKVWKETSNFKIWNEMADEFIFNFSHPQHLGDGIVESNQTYKNITNFFAFKSKDGKVELKSKDPKAQKFISETVKDKENTEVAKSENSAKSEKFKKSIKIDNPMNNLISSWNKWGRTKSDSRLPPNLTLSPN